VLGEDEHFFVGKPAVGEHFTQFLELRLDSCVVNVLGQIPQSQHLLSFCDQFRQRFRYHALQELVLGCFVLFQSFTGALFVGGLGLQDVIFLADAALEGEQLLDGKLPRLDVFDNLVELAQAALE